MFRVFTCFICFGISTPKTRNYHSSRVRLHKTATGCSPRPLTPHRNRAAISHAVVDCERIYFSVSQIIYIYIFESLEKTEIGVGYNHPSQLLDRVQYHTFPGNVCLVVLAEKVRATDHNSFEGKRRPKHVPSWNFLSMRWERLCAVKIRIQDCLPHWELGIPRAKVARFYSRLRA